MSAKQYFLAKSGQTFGPFSESQIEALRESGEYEKYSWFWEHGATKWAPIDPPPAAPNLHADEPAAHGSHAQSQATARNSISDERARSLSVVCYDQQTVLNGFLAHVTDAGCEFVTDSHSTAPEFQAKLSVMLHLFDQRSGHSMNVSGRIGQAERRGGKWHYRIHWKRCPQLIQESSVSASA